MNSILKALAFGLAIFLTAAAFSSCIGGSETGENAGNTDFPLSPGLMTHKPDVMPTAETETTAGPDSESLNGSDEYRRSTLYYLTDEGYILPVTVDIPWEAGIAKACLSKLVSNPENRIETQQKGLKTLIPEGTAIEMNISENKATVNLKNMPPVLSAEQEKAMFTAIVNTLTEFDNIKTVSVMVNGRTGKTANGVEMPVEHGKYALNTENAEVAVSGSAEPMLLFFPNGSGSHIIPVTRYIEGSGDLYTAISGLAEGTALENLRSCFPENTLVLATTVENGMLHVNLTSDFTTIAETPGLFELAEQTVLMTARQYADVNGVRFFVNGAPYTPEG